MADRGTNGSVPPAFGGDELGLQRLADVEPRAVDWIWRPRLPRGKLVDISGDPDLGKSTMGLDLVARVTRGGVMPDGTQVCVANVLLLSAEDDAADTIVPRLQAAGADLRRVSIPRCVVTGEEPPRAPQFPDDAKWLEQLIRERHVALVILDPLEAFLSESVKTHTNHLVRRALAPLAGVAERTGACIVLGRHLTKQSGGRALYRAQGSIGIIAAARVGLLVAPDREDEARRVLAIVKCNLIGEAEKVSLAFRLVPDVVLASDGREIDVPTVRWEGETDLRADDLLAVPTPPETDGQRQAGDFLRETLARATTPQAGVPAGELKAAAGREGINAKTLERAKARLGVRHTRPQGFQGAWLWYWPEDAR